MTFWNKRYSTSEYIYGVAPNRWLEQQARQIRPGGRVLSLGEGEGRNAVWLAQHGFEVDAVDGSEVALDKARRLAASRGVSIATHLAHLATYQPPMWRYDAVVLIYVHLNPHYRATVHTAAAAALRASGIVILEAFAPRQLQFTSGGPKDPEMLYDAAMIRSDFPGVTWDALEELEIDLDEGRLHRGRASVVRGLGRVAVPR